MVFSHRQHWELEGTRKPRIWKNPEKLGKTTQTSVKRREDTICIIFSVTSCLKRTIVQSLHLWKVKENIREMCSYLFCREPCVSMWDIGSWDWILCIIGPQLHKYDHSYPYFKQKLVLFCAAQWLFVSFFHLSQRMLSISGLETVLPKDKRQCLLVMLFGFVEQRIQTIFSVSFQYCQSTIGPPSSTLTQH